jgi:hypothetical protein
MRRRLFLRSVAGLLLALWLPKWRWDEGEEPGYTCTTEMIDAALKEVFSVPFPVLSEADLLRLFPTSDARYGGQSLYFDVRPS